MALLKGRRRRRARKGLKRIGFGGTKRFLFFRTTRTGRALKPFAKILGI